MNSLKKEEEPNMKWNVRPRMKQYLLVSSQDIQSDRNSDKESKGVFQSLTFLLAFFLLLFN
jgi:hypothetical protein